MEYGVTSQSLMMYFKADPAKSPPGETRPPVHDKNASDPIELRRPWLGDITAPFPLQVPRTRE